MSSNTRDKFFPCFFFFLDTEQNFSSVHKELKQAGQKNSRWLLRPCLQSPAFHWKSGRGLDCTALATPTWHLTPPQGPLKKTDLHLQIYARSRKMKKEEGKKKEIKHELNSNYVHSNVQL